MASKQTEELNKLYLEWVAALKANPEMPLDELRHMLDQWERITQLAAVTACPLV
jgi:monoterpene epsilon-lactone hydrolase